MYFERDYILRLIQMMGDLMRRIAELMTDLQRMKLLDDTCLRHCGMSLEAAEALSEESLIDMLDDEPRFVLSELLYLHAAHITCEDDAAQRILLKSLRLLCSLTDDGPLCEQRANRLEALKEQTLALLSADELLACAMFFTGGERYDFAEDALFQAIERAEPSRQAEILSAGVPLLERAHAAAPDALALCGLTREETAESLGLLRTLAGLAGL